MLLLMNFTFFSQFTAILRTIHKHFDYYLRYWLEDGVLPVGDRITHRVERITGLKTKPMDIAAEPFQVY